jgi:hypothetical protein
MKRIARALVLSGALAFSGCGANVSININNGVLSMSTFSISFSATFNAGSDPAPVTVNVTNTGTGTLNFSAVSDSPWLMVTPSSGTAPRMIQVSAIRGSLASGSFIGHITVTAAGAQDSPGTITVTFNIAAPAASSSAFWQQWGANPQHTGMVGVAGQNVAHQLADIVYDPFVSQEQAQAGGELLAHYQAPLVDGNDVYIMTKTGAFTTAANWNSQVWNESRFTWENNQLVHVWDFPSDWTPEPNGPALAGWEPLFHAVDTNNFIYVPGAGGTIHKISKNDGSEAAHINPFAGMNPAPVAANTFVSGPLTADGQGNIFFNVIQLSDPSQGNPWLSDVVNSWLVKVTPQGTATAVTYATLVPGAPSGSSMTCPGTFFGSGAALPWPPSPSAVASSTLCGSQRPGVNIAPVVAPDGTIYTASVAQFDSMEAFLVAVNPDLTPKWAASLQELLTDGCGTLISIDDSSNSDVNGCRNGSTPGVDPTTNTKGSGSIMDQASSSPTVLPDGSVLFGAMTNYNSLRGHLFHFDAAGKFLNAFDFGWDSTPGVWTHDGSFSIIIKDNHYPAPLYCARDAGCRPEPEVYYITQLNPNASQGSSQIMQIEWQFQNTNTSSCQRNSAGSTSCTPNTNPNGFEWCVNMPAVDVNGTVYVNSEDGNMYALPQGHTGVFTSAQANLFLNLAIGAAYTPLAIGPDGKLYTQNDGHLFVVGN